MGDWVAVGSFSGEGANRGPGWIAVSTFRYGFYVHTRAAAVGSFRFFRAGVASRVCPVGNNCSAERDPWPAFSHWGEPDLYADFKERTTQTINTITAPTGRR